MNAPLQHFAAAVASLPGRALTLAEALDEAVAASHAVSIGYAAGFGEYEMDRRENAAWDAKQALIAAFEAEGISLEMAERIGEVL